MTKDLTGGHPLKVILWFAFPLVLGNLFQQFYSLADTIIVGRFVGVDALAAVGSTGSINYMILGFVLGSLFEVFPGVPQGWELLISLVTFALGFAAVYALSWQETHAKQA